MFWLSIVIAMLSHPASVHKHEFYVGITDIAYSEESKLYEVGIKLFTDDLELGVEKAFGVNPRLGTVGEHHRADSLVFKYVDRHFAMRDSDKGQDLKANHIGVETELDITWIYLEYYVGKPLQAIAVKNELMMELYRDQSHIIHLKQGGRTRTELLHRGRRSAQFKL